MGYQKRTLTATARTNQLRAQTENAARELAQARLLASDKAPLVLGVLQDLLVLLLRRCWSR